MMVTVVVVVSPRVTPGGSVPKPSRTLSPWSASVSCRAEKPNSASVSASLMFPAARKL